MGQNVNRCIMARPSLNSGGSRRRVAPPLPQIEDGRTNDWPALPESRRTGPFKFLSVPAQSLSAGPPGRVFAPEMANGPTGNSTGGFVTKKIISLDELLLSVNILIIYQEKTARQAACGCGWPTVAFVSVEFQLEVVLPDPQGPKVGRSSRLSLKNTVLDDVEQS